MTMSIPNCTSAIDSPLLLNKSEIEHDDRRRSGREISCCLLLSILGAVRLLVAVSWVSCLFTLLFDKEVDDKFGIFFVAVPSSVLGAKKEEEKKEESSC